VKTPPLPPNCNPLAVLQPLMTDHFIACHYRCAWLDEAERRVKCYSRGVTACYENAEAWEKWGRGEWKGEGDGH
jgi:hypothetical protein